MAEEKDASTLPTEEPDGEGNTWYSLKKGDMCYLLSYEEKDDYYLVSLTENIGSEQRSTWLVPKDDVTVSSF
ncbi:MAG: hypothetical protein AB4041_01765 [Microcystaceae cyanobacterium]